MIYLIDDEIDVAQTLAELIETGLGLSVTTFSGLDQCIERLDYYEEQPEVKLIISDILMPTGSGLRLKDYIRRKNLNIPVLFISGHADKISDDDIILLRKPVQKELLFEQIRTSLADK